jgi:hypothetical protein
VRDIPIKQLIIKKILTKNLSNISIVLILELLEIVKINNKKAAVIDRRIYIKTVLLFLKLIP